VISGELPAAINGAAAPGDSLAAGPPPLAPLMDSEPSDPRSRARIRRYPFGGYFFLKSPWISSVLNPQSKTYPCFTLSRLKSVLLFAEFRNTLLDIYRTATEMVLLIKYSF